MTDYVVYNIHTGNVITQAVPREMAETICNTYNSPPDTPRYAIRLMNDFDWGALIEEAIKDDAADFEARVIEDEYDSQWGRSLHPFARGVVYVWPMVVFAVGLVARVAL